MPFHQLLAKLAQAVPVMLVVTTVAFGLVHLAPGDPAVLMAGETASPAEIEELRTSLGLNEPLHVQYGRFVTSFFTGDFGTSVFSRKPVTELMAQRLEPTLMLTGLTLALSIAMAIPVGVLAASRVRSWVDRSVMAFSVLGFSVPSFILAYVLVFIFASKLHWVPVQGYKPLSQGLWPALQSLLLPAIALSVTYMALIARITRTSMIDVLNQDFVRTAKAKGLSKRRVLLRHGLKNAAIPIVTIIGIGLASLISGVVIIETVFNLPGLGRLLVDAILTRDYPVIQAMLMVFSGAYVIINVMIDIVYVFLDPRIRY